MSKLEHLKNEMKKKGYQITEDTPTLGEISLREGRGGHLIMEIEDLEREKIKNLLNSLHCRTMIRVKDDGKTQFIIKM